MLRDRDVNLAQIRRGHAWWYREYAAEQTLKDQLTYALPSAGRAK